MARKSREEVRFTVERHELEFVIKPGNPLTFCEVYGKDGRLVTYGIANCHGGRFISQGAFGYWSEGDTYDYTTGARMAFKSALNKLFPYNDPQTRESTRMTHENLWLAWKRVFMKELVADGDSN